MATFRADRVTVTFADIEVIGLAPGTFVKAERTKDTMILEKGAYGEPAWLQDLDDSGKVTFMTMQASPSNNLLGAKAAADEAAGTGYGEVVVRDRNTNAQLARGTGRLTRTANMEWNSQQVVPREGVVMVERLELTHDGITVR